MLIKRSEIDKVYFKHPLPKWMTLAWDSFRILDNNSNNVIFFLPQSDTQQNQ